MTDQELLDAFTDIAQRNVPSLITLTEQDNGRLDFHDVHVTSIIDMLQAAYNLGSESKGTSL